METPWGLLQDLDSKDKDFALTILSTDKDSLIEGLVVENTFEQILSPLGRQPSLPSASGEDSHELVFLDVETAIGLSDGHHVAFVWVRKPTAGLRRYLIALSKLMPVLYVKLVAGTFVAKNVSANDGRPFGDSLPLNEAAAVASRNKAIVREVDLSVRDSNRQRQAFWGHLSGIYGDDLWPRVVLPRIFINHGISPYFPGVWNLDRICLYKDDLWVLEVKHKFPFGNPLKFGINTGEARNFARLHGVGIRCLHVILVKPEWEKNRGAMYLYNNRSLAHSVAVIGSEIGGFAESLMSQQHRVAPETTSVGGRTTVPYYDISVSAFSWIGTLAQTNEELASQLKNLMDGQLLRRTQVDDLRHLRQPPPRQNQS